MFCFITPVLNSAIILNIRIYLRVSLLVKPVVSERFSCLPQMLMSVQRMSICVKMGSAWTPLAPFVVSVRWGSLLPLTAGPAKVSCCCCCLSFGLWVWVCCSKAKKKQQDLNLEPEKSPHVSRTGNFFNVNYVEVCFHLFYDVFLAFIHKYQSRDMPQQFCIFF